jgi:serine/threonine-protein kinase HipA
VSFVELFASAVGADPDRVGIAGVQDKVSGRMISVPVTLSDGAGHLLKFDPPDFPHLVHNEAFFLGMARACGIETAGSKVITDRDGRAGLLVTRFDRRRSDTQVVALACEDGCQVNNRYPADKYALDTEPMIAGLATPCRARLVATRDFMRQLAFAIVTGNGDLHAKNLSIVRYGQEWLPAPAYDLPSSAPYGDRTLAVAIGGTRDGQVSRRRLLVLGESLGLPSRATEMLLDDLLARAEQWPDRVADLPFDQRRRRDLAQLMRRRMSLLRGND